MADFSQKQEWTTSMPGGLHIPGSEFKKVKIRLKTLENAMGYLSACPQRPPVTPRSVGENLTISRCSQVA